ncbi:MAG: hypothetical protein HY074_02560 [Deltaproteobacteria bacterium]|nr:hypothetical protein [Deltaproteobacteria bacterium]
MNFSISALTAGFIYGVMGVWLIRYAKREAHIPSVVFGVALLVYPYFIENIYLLWGIGAVILVLAYKMAKA